MKLKGHALVWHGAVPGWANGCRTPIPSRRRAPHPHGRRSLSRSGLRLGRRQRGDRGRRAGAAGHRVPAEARRRLHRRCLSAGAPGRSAGAALLQRLRRRGPEREVGPHLRSRARPGAQGVPIDGVGLQMHISASNPPDATPASPANMRRLAALGLLVNISEMDVQVRDLPRRQTRLDVQKSVYHSIVGGVRRRTALRGRHVLGIHGRALVDRLAVRRRRAAALRRAVCGEAGVLRRPRRASTPVKREYKLHSLRN